MNTDPDADPSASSYASSDTDGDTETEGESEAEGNGGAGRGGGRGGRGGRVSLGGRVRYSVGGGSGGGRGRGRGRGGGRGAGGSSSSSSSSDAGATTTTTNIAFSWSRTRLFDYISAYVLYEKALEAGRAVVTSVVGHPTSRRKPYPMNSVDFAVLASRYLKMRSQRAAAVAERLYHGGWISYPRTETQSFDESIDVRRLVEEQCGSAAWGGYAGMLVHCGGYEPPKKGAKHDQAHPPIHPLRPGSQADFPNDWDSWRVFELVARHFLACCSRDASGAMTSVTVDMGGETFTASGTQILSRGFLDVYPYQKWHAALLPAEFAVGQRFTPSSLTLQEGSTVAPHLLSEQELIQLMDAHGIGTDATIPEHINTVLTREYMTREGQDGSNNSGGGGGGGGGDEGAGRFVPTTLGIGLVQVRRRGIYIACVCGRSEAVLWSRL